MIKDEKTGVVYRKWESGLPRAVLLLVHGLGGHSGRWDFLAGYFLQHHISSYAIELKGFGETPGPQGHIETFDQYYRDIQAILGVIKRENSGKKIFLIGESLGGLIIFLLACLEPYLVDGIICVSPAFKSRLNISLLDQIKIYMSMVFSPRKRFRMPFSAAMCTRDIEVQQYMEHDAKEIRFATAKLLFKILMAQGRARFLVDRIKMPVLFLTAGDTDQIVDSKESRVIFDGLQTRDQQFIEYPGMHHALTIELDREKVFGDMLTWLNKRI